MCIKASHILSLKLTTLGFMHSSGHFIETMLNKRSSYILHVKKALVSLTPTLYLYASHFLSQGVKKCSLLEIEDSKVGIKNKSQVLKV